jgi:L-serine kinase (ADP)
MNVDLHNGQSVDLSIYPLQNLKPHEEIIPPLVEAILEDMRKTGTQRDPILVDEKTGLILDGMHRRAALERVGARFAVCSGFDYEGDGVTLERWLRSFSTTDPVVIAKLDQLFDLEKRSKTEAMHAVDSGESPLAVLSSAESYVSVMELDLDSLYSKLSEFDRYSVSKGVRVQFMEEKSTPSESSYVIYPKIIEKKDVRRYVETNRVFPYKSTRHTVVIRPLNVCFPVDLLQGNDKSKCEAKLKKIVDSSNPKILQPKTPYNGRQYSEPIAVILS